MASTRKSRKVNKRFPKVNDEWLDKDGTTANKSSTRKRKLSDLLGSLWSKEELEHFYEAYRKYGKDWRKVASTIRNRQVEMVEALYNMNKAYLSLPEGTATVAGLIAMMTDHYNNLEGSDSGRESNDVPRTSQKPQKRGRGKYKFMSKGTVGRYPDLLQYQSSPSSYGCLSLLKRKRSGDLFAGTRPRAVGKRTPRITVSNMYGKGDRDKIVSPNKLGLKSAANVADDEGVHVAALALAEASQRGSSPQVSQTLGRRVEHRRPSPVHSSERKNFESQMGNSAVICLHMDGDYPEGSLGSREAENGDFARDAESAGAFESHLRVKKLQGKRSKSGGTENDHLDDDTEACSGTEEGLTKRKVRDEIDMEVTYGKSVRTSKSSRKRSRQLFFDDEDPTFDALQTLADLSVNILFPASTVESESSVQIREEKKNVNNDEKSAVRESVPINHQGDKSKIPEKKDRGHSAVLRTDLVTRKCGKPVNILSHDTDALSEIKQKRKQKSLSGKIPIAECSNEAQKSESQKVEVLVEEGKRSINKAKRGSHASLWPKQGKLIKPQDRPSSTDLGKTGTAVIETTVEVSVKNQVMPVTITHRRKMNQPKSLTSKELKFNDSARDCNNKAVDLKDKLSLWLSSRLLRRWCIYEWFYSSIDYPWFARNEFVEYLNHVGLGHVPRLTRVEWDVIRSSLGRPRRLSEKFLQEEREKLEEYRELVRTHYAELRAGVREGLPTDLARPLSVGQRVIACHPKTRDAHDGSILTVDRNRCRVQFDRPELGVEFVMDVDCMPLNPAENIPESLRRHTDIINKFCNGFTEIKLAEQFNEWKIGGSVRFASNESLDIADGNSLAASIYPMNTLMTQAKGDIIDAIGQAKAAVNGVTVATQQAMYTQSCTPVQIEAKEADIRALADVARALDKKEALLIELRHMNEEVSQKDGGPIKDLEYFRKQYAMVLLQLRDANDQVASALFYLRRRNTYHGNSTPTWIRPNETSGGPAGPPGSSDSSGFLNHDQGSHVMEVIDSSRRKARTMVDTAAKTMSALKEGEDAFVRIGDALDSANIRNSVSGPSVVSAVRYTPDPGQFSATNENHTNSCKSEPPTGHALSSKLQITYDATEVQLPFELISSCVATLYMIQACSERQYPPAEVAQILDSAVTSLLPCCPQNLPIYREIETCMGIIKNQMLALIPTPTTSLPAEPLV